MAITRTWSTAELWPANTALPSATGRKSIRYFKMDTAANGTFDKLLFIQGLGAKPQLEAPNNPPGSTAQSTFGTPQYPGGPYVAGTETAGVVTTTSVTPPPLPPGMVPPVTPRTANDPAPAIWASHIRIYNDNGAAIPLEFSFDGVNVHGRILAGQNALYENRYECGIAVRGVGGTCAYRIEAW